MTLGGQKAAHLPEEIGQRTRIRKVEEEAWDSQSKRDRAGRPGPPVERKDHV